jgi:hypothetical protein
MSRPLARQSQRLASSLSPGRYALSLSASGIFMNSKMNSLFIILCFSLLYTSSSYSQGIQAVNHAKVTVTDNNQPLETDSLNVRIVGKLEYLPGEMYAYGLDIEDSLAFVTDLNHGLRIISIANPTRPYEISSLDPEGSGGAIEVVGNYAYIADYLEGFKVISLEDINNPELVGFSQYWGLEYVTIYGEYAYIGGYGVGSIKILSIEDPTNPIEVGSYHWGLTEDLYIYNLYAYVALDYTGGAGGLGILDISDPIHPTEVNRIDLEGTAWEIEIAEPYAFVASETAGLAVLSIEDPTNPVELSYVGDYFSYRLDVSDDFLYVFGIDYLSVISISDPYHPLEVGHYHNEDHTAWDILVSGSTAFVAQTDAGFIIYEYYGPTSINDSNETTSSLPRLFSLSQNYPNPFNPSTTIQYDIPEGNGTVPVKILVYDIRGRLVRKLVDEEKESGSYQVHWDGIDERGLQVSTGLYLYRLEASELSVSRKMLIVR